MNLKRLNDSLRYVDGVLRYHGMNGDILGNNVEEVYNRTGISGFGPKRNNISEREKSVETTKGGVKVGTRMYTLLKIEDIEGFGTVDELQQWFKHSYKQLDSDELEELFADLFNQFNKVMHNWAKVLKSVYPNNETINVHIHTPESSSTLASDFAKYIVQEPNETYGKVNVHFVYNNNDFVSVDATFDVDGYIDYLKSKGHSDDYAINKAIEAKSMLNNSKDVTGKVRLHETPFKGKLSKLREYVHKLDKGENFISGEANLFLDDFVTSGATIKQALRSIGGDPGTSIGVSLFKK